MSHGIKLPPKLSAEDRSSFAYTTIKDRLPIILVKTIDSLHRNRKNLLNLTSESQLVQWGLTGISSDELEDDVKDIIGQLAKLRKELETNKPVELFEELSLNPLLAYFNEDVEAWNKALNEHRLDSGSSLPRWFDSPWLLMECYMYRRIKDIMLRSEHLKMFDPFLESKQQSHVSSVPQMKAVGSYLLEVIKTIGESKSGDHPSERSVFGTFVQLALWANKCDLSINCMEETQRSQQDIASDIRGSLDDLQENILCDNSSQLWFLIQAIRDKLQEKLASHSEIVTQPIFIDLVADNVGFEIYVDFCLLHFLTLFLKLESSQATKLKLRIHVKRMSWFVSDALKCDIDYLLEFLDKNADVDLQALSKQWRTYMEKGLWEIHEDRYWTQPGDYSSMQLEEPNLYDKLSQSSLIVFKGDLNYRKLTGDRKWHLLTPFVSALNGFAPANLATLRTIKADVVAGIEDINIYASINNNELPRDWKTSGNYGLIQVVDFH